MEAYQELEYNYATHGRQSTPDAVKTLRDRIRCTLNDTDGLEEYRPTLIALYLAYLSMHSNIERTTLLILALANAEDNALNATERTQVFADETKLAKLISHM